MNHVVLRINLHVFFPKVVQDSHFDQSLMVEPFFVSDYFDGDMLPRFVIQGPDDLTETTLSNHFKNLVPEKRNRIRMTIL